MWTAPSLLPQTELLIKETDLRTKRDAVILSGPISARHLSTCWCRSLLSKGQKHTLVNFCKHPTVSMGRLNKPWCLVESGNKAHYVTPVLWVLRTLLWWLLLHAALMNPNRTELYHGTKSTDLPSRDQMWEVYKSPSTLNGFSAIAYATSPQHHWQWTGITPSFYSLHWQYFCSFA